MILNKRILLELKKHTVWVFTFLSNMLRDDFEPEELPLPSETSVINRESPTQLLAAGEPYLGLQSDADPQIWPDTESNYRTTSVPRAKGNPLSPRHDKNRQSIGRREGEPKKQKNYYRKRLKKCVLEIHSLFYDAIARSLSFAHDRQEECVINEKRRETCL